jgi:hypothetical protein
LNLHPPDLCLLRSYDYRHEPPGPAKLLNFNLRLSHKENSRPDRFPTEGYENTYERNNTARHQWSTPIILATQEAEIKRIKVQKRKEKNYFPLSIQFPLYPAPPSTVLSPILLLTRMLRFSYIKQSSSPEYQAHSVAQFTRCPYFRPIQVQAVTWALRQKGPWKPPL